MDLVTVDKRTLRFELSKSAEDAIVSDMLTVTNISHEHIAFKVKTTNQSRYIVRPNVGTIPPDDALRIFIGVQPASDVPDLGPSKDKFLLRVAACKGSAHLSPDFWSGREESPTVTGLKFRVEFVEPALEHATSPPLILHPTPIVPVPANPSSALSTSPPSLSPAPPSVPHVRDLPPDLLTTTAPNISGAGAPTTAATLISPTPAYMATTSLKDDDSTTTSTDFRRTQVEDGTSLGDPDSLLAEGKCNEAVAKVSELQALLDKKNLELARLKTELAETRAETERVLKEAPVPPLAANNALSDPFGGISVTGFALVLLLSLLTVNILLRLV